MHKHGDSPRIIAGDLNTMRIEPLYREIRSEWNNLFAKKGSGLGWTFPNISSIPFPLITLDYILYRGAIQAIECKVLQRSSADHLAVFGSFKI
ncbi:MAG: endonuclease/exonuclease/phosphatase family protein [Bacteroidota bacterium]